MQHRAASVPRCLPAPRPRIYRSGCVRTPADVRQLDRGPNSVVPEPPYARGRVPHQLSTRRRRGRRRLRRRPRRRGPPRSRARRTALACRACPVVALIPVPVVDVSPTRVPRVTRTPMRFRRRRRVGGRGRPCDQSNRAESHPGNYPHTVRPQRPRSLLRTRHPPSISLRPHSRQLVIPLRRFRHYTLNRNSTTSPSAMT